MGIKTALKKTFELDLRSLSLMRIFIGIVCMVDIIGRLCDLTAHYTDVGIFPRHYWLSEIMYAGNFSFHASNGTWFFMAFIFALHFLIAASFTIGHKTKWSTLLLFLFTASLHNRNWLLNNGGDDVLRVMLLVCTFLPLGEYFSWDAKGKVIQTATQIRWWSGFYYIFQLFCIYYFSAIIKNHPIWYKDFTATYYALQLDFFTRSSAKFLSDHFELLKWITAYTIYLEWLVPIFLMINFIFLKWQNHFKAVTVFLFVTFHLGLIMMMELGTFPWFCIGFWLALLPSSFWFWMGKIKISEKFQYVAKLPAELKLKESFLPKSFALIFALIVLLWNIEEMKSFRQTKGFLADTGSWLQIQQKWNMFAPYPKILNEWFEGNGYTTDGKKIDLFNESENFDETIKKRFYQSIQNKQWRKFYLMMAESEVYVKYFAEYTCRKWNELKLAKLPYQLERVEFILYKQQTLIGYNKDAEVRMPIYQLSCL
jgi:hypothetical protein